MFRIVVVYVLLQRWFREMITERQLRQAEEKLPAAQRNAARKRRKESADEVGVIIALNGVVI